MVCFKYLGARWQSDSKGYLLQGEAGDPNSIDVRRFAKEPLIGLEAGMGDCATAAEWFVGWSMADTTAASTFADRGPPRVATTHTVTFGAGTFTPRKLVGNATFHLDAGIQDQEAVAVEITRGALPTDDLYLELRRNVALQLTLGPVHLGVAPGYTFRSLAHADRDAPEGARPGWELQLGVTILIGMPTRPGPHDAGFSWANEMAYLFNLAAGQLHTVRAGEILGISAEIDPAVFVAGGALIGLMLDTPLWSAHDGLYPQGSDAPTWVHWANLGAEGAIAAAAFAAYGLAGDDIARAGELAAGIHSAHRVLDGAFHLAAPRFYNHYGLLIRTAVLCSEMGLAFAFDAEDRGPLVMQGGQCLNELLLKPLGRRIGVIAANERTLW